MLEFIKDNLQRNRTILINVLVTFLEGFLAAWALTGQEVSKHALVGAGAAAVSLVWNTVVKPTLKAKTELYK